MEPSRYYNSQQQDLNIVSEQWDCLYQQDCYTTPKMVIDDSRSIGQVSLISSPSDEHSY